MPTGLHGQASSNLARSKYFFGGGNLENFVADKFYPLFCHKSGKRGVLYYVVFDFQTFYQFIFFRSLQPEV